MTDMEYPVTVAVDRGGGRIEEVRVGTAVRSGDGFVLRLGELRIQTGAAAASRAPSPAPSPSIDTRRSAPPPAFDAGGGAPPPGGMVFPPYGRSKGQPVHGASLSDLEFYANGCRRTLANPEKARWHDKERTLLAAIEAEIIRQKGMPPMAPDEGGGSRYAPPASSGGFDSGFDDGRPPPDDDIPF
jgi:hypothetical protein